MSKQEVSVLYGENLTQNNGLVRLPNGEQAIASSKAKWSYNRLVLQRQVADSKYKNTLEFLQQLHPTSPLNILSKMALEIVFKEALSVDNKREFQFITRVKKGLNVLSAIALNKRHSLIPPEQLEQIVNDTFTAIGMESCSAYNYQGFVNREEFDSPFGKIQFGLSLDLGDIGTMRAIKVGILIYVERCTNKVLFLNMKNWSGMGASIGLAMERIIRVDNETDTVERFKKAVEKIAGMGYDEKSINGLISKNAIQPLSLAQAKVILDKLFDSYSVGEKVKAFALGEFDKVPDNLKTVGELSMILSNLPINPDTPLKEGTEFAEGNLATVSAIILSYPSISELVAKCTTLTSKVPV